MWDLINQIDVEWLTGSVNDAMQTELADWFLKVGIVWLFVSKKVSGHFAGVEAAVNLVATNLGELKNTVSQDLQMHSERLGKIELGVAKLDLRVKKLETPTGGEANG